jgi:hypothetical protein
VDTLDRVKLRPLNESPDKCSSQSTISISLRNVYMQMRRVIAAKIVDVAEVANIIEVVEG